MKATLALIIILAVSMAATAQPNVEWSRTYGGEWNYWAGLSLMQGADSSLNFAGTARIAQTQQDVMCLVKTSATGDSLSSHTYTAWGSTACTDMERTHDGGYVLAGYFPSPSYYLASFWMVKTDANGDSLWGREFEPDYVSLCLCYAVRQTRDEGYMLAGITGPFESSDRDFFLVKTDANGDRSWIREYGGPDLDECHGAGQTNDGGYFLAGVTYSFGAGRSDAWLLKTDSNGDSVWSRTYGHSSWDYTTSARETSDGGFILALYSTDPDTQENYAWIIRTDSFGDSLWSRRLCAPAVWCNDIREVPDGWILTGNSSGSVGNGGADMWVMKLSAQGDSLWTLVLGGEADDYGLQVIPTLDGGYIVAGVTDSYAPSTQQAWLVKLGPDLSASPTLKPQYLSLVTSYPNPFNAITNLEFDLPKAEQVRISVYDLEGRFVRELLDQRMNAGAHRLGFDASGLTSGVYFARIESGSLASTRKLVLMK